MLEALVIAGIVAAPLSSAGLFLPQRLRTRVAGAWPAARRFILALLGTAILAAAAAAILELLNVTGSNLLAGVAGLIAASVIWLPATRRWSPRAHLCWASSTFLFVTYLCYALAWTFTSHLGPASTAGGLLLWLLEVFAALLSCAYLWEICDALGTEDWRRRPAVASGAAGRAAAAERAAAAGRAAVARGARNPVPAITARSVARERAAGSELPMISLHVPAHNEPPDMVIDTLRSLLRLDLSLIHI